MKLTNWLTKSHRARDAWNMQVSEETNELVRRDNDGEIEYKQSESSPATKTVNNMETCSGR